MTDTTPSATPFRKRHFSDAAANTAPSAPKRPKPARNPHFDAVEAALNAAYGIGEWSCDDTVSSNAILQCTAQSHVGVKMFGGTQPPFKFTIQRMGPDKTTGDYVATLCPSTVAAAAREPIETLDNPIEQVLNRYIYKLRSYLLSEPDLFEFPLKYSSHKKGNKTFVKYEVKSKITPARSGDTVRLLWPWPGEDPHGLRLERMAEEDLGVVLTFSFFVADEAV